MSVKKYCYCENNCKYETLDKEEILTAIANAVATGEIGDCDTGFITKIKTINGYALRFFVGTQDEYEALSAADKQNLFAIITNDTTKEGIENAIEELRTVVDELKTGVIDGTIRAKCLYYHFVRIVMKFKENNGGLVKLFFDFTSPRKEPFSIGFFDFLWREGTHYYRGVYKNSEGNEEPIFKFTQTVGDDDKRTITVDTASGSFSGRVDSYAFSNYYEEDPNAYIVQPMYIEQL